MRTLNAFKAAYGGNIGVNFMTPDILRRASAGNGLHYELSEGRGMSNEPIFGVSVVEETGNGSARKRTDLSQMFHSRAKAEHFIASL